MLPNSWVVEAGWMLRTAWWMLRTSWVTCSIKKKKRQISSPQKKKNPLTSLSKNFLEQMKMETCEPVFSTHWNLHDTKHKSIRMEQNACKIPHRVVVLHSRCCTINSVKTHARKAIRHNVLVNLVCKPSCEQHRSEQPMGRQS